MDNYKDRMSGKSDDKGHMSDDENRKDGKGRKDSEDDRKDYDMNRKGDDDKDNESDYDGKDGNSYNDEDDSSKTYYCNVGEQHCCDTVNTLEEAQNLGLISAFNLWGGGASATELTGLVGKSCSPLAAFGGGKCDAKPICCDKNNIKGLIAVGCSNVNVF
ncbi:hypothetical protein V8E53_004309 [Lactarius tabidus]